ncbi:DNA cytosine methyltransferase [Arthrobacter cryoconiti]|uniref:DNA (cytosine-5-)-methyltransferase n=1 Tax=Arthrobacter cryoconiti TaxID=748907 RepID=A0ABV8QXV7_9MICC|nr:DNA cytosine methyltransferase [Arthrobacter cryoconiti]MCC9068830.1 DNA cytosine methyltransferase [Arthrobacter cryoconiti]
MSTALLERRSSLDDLIRFMQESNNALTATDMFCGAGGSSTGALEVPGVKVKTAMNHWARAIETHNMNHPDTDHVLADIQVTDPRYIASSDILWASPECFTAGHLVTTNRGQVPIDDIKIGDVVLTHKNRWRPVVRTQYRNNAKVVTASGSGHPGIVVTPNHRFWAKSSDRAWNGNGYTRRYGVADWMRMERTLANEALWATPVAADSLPTMDLPPVFRGSPDGWWLLGRWLGDGSMSFGRNHEVTISCGYHEADDLAPVLECTGFRWHRSDKRTAVVFTASCIESRGWIADQCGHGAANKQLPAWTASLPEEDRRAIFDGYMSADGGITQRRHRASTVSRALAVSMRMLIESLGYRVAMAYDNRTTYSIEGRTGVAKQQWILHWEPELSENRAAEAFVEDGHVWSRIRKVEELVGTATVYNIEVEEDHSYVLDGIVVANCTNHSVAKGKKRVTNQPDLFGDSIADEAAQKSRATMWDVPRFAEVHKYKLIITENVVDAAKWVMFDAWLFAMDALGYDHHIVYMNSMHAQLGGLPAPQSRDRMYVMFWLKGNRRPNFDLLMPLAHCPSCDETVRCVQSWKNPAYRWGRYRAQYNYRCPNTKCRNSVVEPGWLPASSAIDWTLRGQRIGDRTKPLVPKTLARIAAGLAKYGKQPMHLAAAGNTYDSATTGKGDYYRVWPTTDSLRTLTGTTEHGLVLDSVRGSNIMSSTGEPFATQTTSYTRSLLVPVEGREGKQAAPVDAVMRTQTTRNETGLLIPPLIMRNNSAPAGQESYLSKPVSEPLGTLTTAGHQSLIIPPGNNLLMEYYGKGQVFPISKAIPTISTTARHALITTMRGTSPEHLASSNAPITDPLRTISAGGNHAGITEWTVPEVEDCEFRMLEPYEISAGMAFPKNYIMTGNKREQVKQAGNAVTPPAARDLFIVAALSLTQGLDLAA